MGVAPAWQQQRRSRLTLLWCPARCHAFRSAPPLNRGVSTDVTTPVCRKLRPGRLRPPRGGPRAGQAEPEGFRRGGLLPRAAAGGPQAGHARHGGDAFFGKAGAASSSSSSSSSCPFRSSLKLLGRCAPAPLLFFVLFCFRPMRCMHAGPRRLRRERLRVGPAAAPGRGRGEELQPGGTAASSEPPVLRLPRLPPAPSEPNTRAPRNPPLPPPTWRAAAHR